MSTLSGKKILLAVSGSIAAYKSAELTRLLIKHGCEVRILMTPAATHFISPLTLSTLSRHQVYQSVMEADQWNNHVELGIWADAMLIAPMTANTLAKCANGLADNIVVATYLSAKCPVFFAPAMDLDMWVHPSTKRNVETLQSFGNHLIPVGHGELASGLVGDGRMAEPAEIGTILQAFFSKKKLLEGKRALVTAGPTYEEIDPVRYIGNHSSGKMGVAIANALAEYSASVDLILGPSDLRANANVQTHHVRSAREMFDAAQQLFPEAAISVFAAAVADYTPATVAEGKIKKSDGPMTIELKRTKDIAATLGNRKKPSQLTVGFALETQNELENARAKLVKKNFDFVVLNSLRDPGSGFQHDTNKVQFVYPDNKIIEFGLKPKTEVAKDIADAIVDELKAKKNGN